jgi:hypothetical protein
MASYIQILTSSFRNKSAANRPSPTYAPPPPAVIETPPPAAPEVVEPVVEVPTVEETPAPSDEKPEETEAPCENTDSEIV